MLQKAQADSRQGRSGGRGEIRRRVQKFNENKNRENPPYFIDVTHPHHSPVAGYGWIKHGGDYPIPFNTDTERRRLNTQGAFNTEKPEPLVRYDETINAQSPLALLRQPEERHPQAEKIYAMRDKARYYRSALVMLYLQPSWIEPIFLPAYAPQLNVIERILEILQEEDALREILRDLPGVPKSL